RGAQQEVAGVGAGLEEGLDLAAQLGCPGAVRVQVGDSFLRRFDLQGFVEDRPGATARSFHRTHPTPRAVTIQSDVFPGSVPRPSADLTSPSPGGLGGWYSQASAGRTAPPGGRRRGSL